MARIGYIVTELPEQHIEKDEQRIQKENCEIIYNNMEGKSTELKKMMDNLNDRDEVIF